MSPMTGDLVVGIVVETHGENFSVDVGGPQLALLPILDFNGATRRNRPMLGYGDVVYARVSLADRDIDPQVSCLESGGSARSQGLGPLRGGYVLKVATGCARDLLDADDPSNVLALLGSRNWSARRR